MKLPEELREQIACEAYNTATQYVNSILGSPVIPTWEGAGTYTKERYYETLDFYFANPNSTVIDLHDEYVRRAESAGYSIGKTYCTKKKTSPHLGPYVKMNLLVKIRDAVDHTIINTRLNEFLKGKGIQNG